MDIVSTLVSEFHLKKAQVDSVIALLDDGNTIPFIARYRKEQTGSLDDQVLRELADRLTYLRNLNETREKYRATIEEQGALTEELAAALDRAVTMTELDDIYRPYRPKRRTRATVAKERGLEPLDSFCMRKSQTVTHRLWWQRVISPRTCRLRKMRFRVHAILLRSGLRMMPRFANVCVWCVWRTGF